MSRCVIPTSPPRLVIALLATLVLAAPAGATAPDTLWSRTFGEGVANAIAEASDGSVVAAGWGKLLPTDDRRIRLLKTDTTGDLIFDRFYMPGEAHDVVELPDQGYLVVGRLYGPLTPAGIIIRTDSNGDTLWTRIRESDAPVAAALTNASTCVIAGGEVVQEIDLDGDVLWSRQVPSDIMDVAPVPGGGFYAIGNVFREADFGWFLDGQVIRLSSTGDTLWTRLYGDDDLDEYFESLLLLPGDTLVVAGKVQDSHSLLIKLAQDGEVIWETGRSGGLGFFGVTDHNGGYVAVGTDLGNNPPSPYHDMDVFSTSPAGDTLWTLQLGVPTAFEAGQDISSTADGGLVACGQYNCVWAHWGCQYPQFWIVRFAATPTSSVPVTQSPYADRLQFSVLPGLGGTQAEVRFHASQPGVYVLSMYDLMGRFVRKFHFAVTDSGEVVGSFETSQLSASTYFCRLTGPSGESAARKLTVWR